MDNYNLILNLLRKGQYKAVVCQDCGKESIPYFGFASPCRYNNGSHHNFKLIDSTKKREQDKLRAAYSSVPSFDRANFDKHAPIGIKNLLTNK